MDFSEKYGIDVDEAVRLALNDLKLTIDEVDVTVVEEPSRGFFGIGSKLALVRVEKKKPVKKQESLDVEEKKDNLECNCSCQQQKTQAKSEEKTDSHKNSEKPRKDKRENVKNVKSQAASEPAPVLQMEEELSPCDDHIALKFIEEITNEMGLDVSVSAKKGTDSLYIDINGKDSGTIIGKRGQTLDAIQYLASLVANKGKEDYLRVVVDAENYRRKREKTLMLLANRLAAKVIKTRRSVKLEPMNPYERKVIHATLQNNPRVTTRSEGQEPYRRVIIELK